MSIESIIGITSGLIGIAGGAYWLYNLLEKQFKKRPIAELFVELMDKKTSDKERRDILKRMNTYALVNNKIKKEYIQNFTLEKRGKEEVLFDICDSNDIEPTDDICKSLINASMPSLRKKYQEKREQKTVESISVNDMNRIEKEANFKREQTVYVSELLKTNYPKTFNHLVQILNRNKVKYAFLKGTKDIWCRDYMPVQTQSGKFIQFKYDPSYLKGNKEWEKSRSDTKEILEKNDFLQTIKIEESDINLDGGNVLICDGRAILSDRVFSENPERDKESLKTELSKLLECEIIIIPALKSQNEDLTGHADGMVRFVNRNTIIGNERRADEYQYMKDGLQNAIDTFGLTYIDIPYFEDKDRENPVSAVGIYVNYLEVNNLIVFPVFGRDEDKQAIAIVQKTFPDRIIETIDYNEIAKEGGLLNCTTWVISN